MSRCTHLVALFAAIVVAITLGLSAAQPTAADAPLSDPGEAGDRPAFSADAAPVLASQITFPTLKPKATATRRPTSTPFVIPGARPRGTATATRVRSAATPAAAATTTLRMAPTVRPAATRRPTATRPPTATRRPTATPTRRPTATPTRPPTATPTRRPTATPPPPSFSAGPTAPVESPSLPIEIRMAGPGFLFRPPGFCEDAVSWLPAAIWAPSEQGGSLCIYGFQDGERVWVELFDAVGTPVSAREHVAQTGAGQTWVWIEVDTSNYVEGEWTVSVSAASVQAQMSFTAYSLPPSVIVRLIPDSDVTAAGRGLKGLRQGDGFTVDVTNLPPRSAISVGIYYSPPDSVRLVTRRYEFYQGWRLASSSDGRLGLHLALDDTDPSGEYCLLASASSGYAGEENSNLGGAACFTVQ